MSAPSRREFIQSAATLAATTAAARVTAAPAKRGANDRIRVAVAGFRRRGRRHIDAVHALASKNIELAALCDVDANVLAEQAGRYEKMSGKKVQTYADLRTLLDDKSIDAVCYATPNHWHALGTVWACQAGKDVYVEKPGSHNISEGRKMVDAARKHNRIVQHGTQCRSSANIREAMRRLKDGVIGRVYVARGISFKFRHSAGAMKTAPAPKGLDWDAWVGPAPEQAYADLKCLGGGWHRLWDFGNGDIGNQGVHQLDMMRWGLGIDTHPNRVQSMGGLFVHEDEDLEAPNMQIFAFQYDDRNLLMQFEVRSWYTNHEAGMGDEFPFVDKRNTVGIIFLGTEGYMIIPDYSSFHTYLGRNRTPGPAKSDFTNPMMDVPHFANFFEAVRAHDPKKLCAEIEEGHKSCVLPHLANAAYRTRRTLEFDPSTERFVDDAEANAYLTRDYRNSYVMPEV